MMETGTLVLLAFVLPCIMGSISPPAIDVNCARDGVSTSPRMHNSQQAKDGMFPFMVSIFTSESHYSSNAYQCGGAVISEAYVLTAAHCVLSKLNRHQLVQGQLLTVVAGDLNLCEVEPDRECISKVEEVIPHPEYDGYSEQHDIALLKVEQIITCNGYVQKICLPLSPPPSLSAATQMGWGRTELGYSLLHRSIMRYAETRVYNDETCGPHHAELHTMLCVIHPSQEIYIGAHDGDSGSPLLQVINGKNVTIGLVQGGPDHVIPGIIQHYTSVHAYIDWITHYVQDACFA